VRVRPGAARLDARACAAGGTRAATETGDAEIAAFRDLDATLRGQKPAPGSRLEEIRQRVRLAYVQGAETYSREDVRRGLTRDKLGRVIGRYVGR
jgi:hypothetical protein